jgi:hypothetical protein
VFSQTPKKTSPPVNKKPVLSPEERWVNSLKLKDDTARVKYIEPQIDTVQYIPKNFYIAAVVDATGMNDSIGYSLQPKSTKQQRLSLKGGTAGYFSKLASISVKKDTTLFPVLLKITKLSVTDERVKYTGDITSLEYAYEFASIYKKDTIRLYRYTANASTRTLLSEKKSYDSLFYKSDNLWLTVDEYMQDLADKHQTFCKGVKLIFHWKTKAANADTLCYTGDYQLNWDDYRGDAESEDGLLSYVFVDYDIEQSYKDRYIMLDVALSTVFLRRESWVSGSPMKREVLQHESYKLKLAYAYMLKLRKELESLQLDQQNYQVQIPATYKRLQKDFSGQINTYNKETNYGLKKKEQQYWQGIIDKMLVELN